MQCVCLFCNGLLCKPQKVTDGVFDPAGNFHPVPGIDSDQATIIFRKKVFAMMKENNRISDGLVENMRNWRHSGFLVHNDDAPNRRVCRKSWAKLIYQVYETDPLQCPNPAELRSPLQGGIRALDSKFKICSKS